jgi:hypothetical protein
VFVIDPEVELPIGMCAEEALQMHEDARNRNPEAQFATDLARWKEKSADLDSCRQKLVDSTKAELEVVELDDRTRASLETIQQYVCDPGEKPDGPTTVELRLSDASEKTVDGTKYTVNGEVSAKPGLVVKQLESGDAWQEFVRAPGHTGRIRCFVEEKRGDDTKTLPVVRWDSGMWRFLRSNEESLSGDLDGDLLSNWLDPDANGDGTLDLAQRLGIEMPAFESTLQYENLELR